MSDGPATAPLDRSFFDRPVARVAPELVGCAITVDGVGGEIVEVERYQQDDPASHSFGGPRPRTATMFGPAGALYVYRSYGLHWCANVVCGSRGRGEAVLLRALEPRWGVPAMAARRGRDDERSLCSGPGRLAQALGLTGADDGAALTGPRIRLFARSGPVQVASGPRIGISRAAERPWRFVRAGSRYLSRPLPRGAAA